MVVYTPTTSSILEGITRDSVIVLARDLGLEVVEKNLTRDDVYTADELFFTGTASELTPASEVDGRQIGDGRIGMITQQIQRQYTLAVMGELAEYERWLTWL